MLPSYNDVAINLLNTVLDFWSQGGSDLQNSGTVTSTIEKETDQALHHFDRSWNLSALGCWYIPYSRTPGSRLEADDGACHEGASHYYQFKLCFLGHGYLQHAVEAYYGTESIPKGCCSTCGNACHMYRITHGHSMMDASAFAYEWSFRMVADTVTFLYCVFDAP